MKSNVKHKRGEFERLRKEHRKELKKSRPDLYQFDEEIRVKGESCRNQDELDELMQWASSQPLYTELLESEIRITVRVITTGLSIYEERLLALITLPKPHLPMVIISLIEEMAVVCGTKAEDNITWQTARKAVRAYQKFLEAKRLARSDQKRLDKAELEYFGRLEDLGRQLVFRGLEPFQGTAFDPLTWFLTLDKVIDGVKKGWGVKLTASRVRYYSRLGLIPKPIRAGERGRTLYPPTVMARLALINLMKEEGYTIEGTKARMSIEIERNITPWVRGWEFGYGLYAELVSPEREAYVRMVETAFTRKKKGRQGQKT